MITMTEIIFGNSIAKKTVTNLVDDFAVDQVIGTFDSVLDGNVRKARFNWQLFHATLGRIYVTIPAGSIYINNVDVVTPITFYVYLQNIDNMPTMLVSMDNPITSPTITRYFLVAMIRLKSVAGSLTVYFSKTIAQDGCYELVHNIREDVIFTDPVWLSGIDPVIAGTGHISVTSGKIRYPGNEPMTIEAVSSKKIVLDNEEIVDRLNDVVRYTDNTRPTEGCWHKLLLGILRDTNINSVSYIVMRQNKPASEYTSAVAAKADAENMAATAFPTAYKASVLPLAYLVTKVGDWSAVGSTIIDIRATGLTKTAGVSVVSSHHSLTDLSAYDDHPQYLKTEGTRTLTGNLTVSPGITIDGVDISAHAATANAHHDPITLSASADSVLGLSIQQITLDTQNTSTFLAGPAVSDTSPATPTFRKIRPNDIEHGEGILTLTNGINNNVALTTGVDCYIVAGPTATFGISGFTGAYPGRTITIANPNINFNMTAYHLNAGSTAANQIICPGGMADSSTTRYGLQRFQYFAITQKWMLIGEVP